MTRVRERLLGIDYGRKRIGIAAADALWIAAHPIDAVANDAHAFTAIAALCEEREIDRIVVGLPLHMSGADSDMAREVRVFAAKLEAHVHRPIAFIDERLSSVTAEDLLKGRSPARRRKEKGRVDAVAAAQILKDYMAAHEGDAA
ncbi:MAG: Holliday junction resolvase RuvX [Planctomycetes bacterium]|nr:Holliday junction resolvase RuvX [Planctomycetota bacterium]MCC7171729.1 Holliday junction resolvase RuvX [Planctomycetota bacterium]